MWLAFCNMALKFKLVKASKQSVPALTLFTANTWPKHVVQLLTLTRSYFIVLELQNLGTMEIYGAVPIQS